MESSTIANHVVALVKGVTTSQTIDMAVVLQVSPASLLPLLAPCLPHFYHVVSQFPLTVCWWWLCGLRLMQQCTKPACWPQHQISCILQVHHILACIQDPLCPTVLKRHVFHECLFRCYC